MDTHSIGATELVDAGGNLALRSYVDLRPGRVTRFERNFRVRVVVDGQAPGAWEDFTTALRSDVSGSESKNGVYYTAVRTVADDEVGTVQEDLLRTDKSGLYQWQSDMAAGTAELAGAATAAAGLEAAFARAQDRAGVAPDAQAAYAAAWTRLVDRAAAARAAVGGPRVADTPLRRNAPAELSRPPGGVIAEEITLLHYPYRPGNTWDGRIGFNTWTVEAVELYSTPVGRFHSGRLRIDLPGLLGPDDIVRTWWGAPGEVSRQFHFETEATDESGGVIGTLEMEESITLLEYVPGAY